MFLKLICLSLVQPSKSKNWKNGENTRNFSKIKNKKFEIQGMSLGRGIQNFRKLAQLEIPKNLELQMT